MKTNLIEEERHTVLHNIFLSKDINTFNELVIKIHLLKNTRVSQPFDISHYEKREPFTTKCLSIELYHNINFDISVNFELVYQPEEDSPVGQILQKNVQCFLSLFFIILNSERELN